LEVENFQLFLSLAKDKRRRRF